MKKTLFLLLTLLPYCVFTQVIMNEVAPTNSGYFTDEDGDPTDWIEILNTGTSTVNLNGYGITDDDKWNKWQLPAIDLAAGERKIIYASGKNRNSYGGTLVTIDHWETAIFEDDSWGYFTGTTDPAADWNTTAFSGIWSSGLGGFGFGDGDDNTTIPSGNISVYYRKTFNVLDKTKLVSAILSMDYDDAFVAYLNGVEIARSNIAGTPDHTSLATADHEAVMYDGGYPESFPVDTALLFSSLEDGLNVLAIEIHNVSASSSDLTGRSWLHFGISTADVLYYDNPIWFTAASGGNLHTNFKLSAGEKLSLYNSAGILTDTIRIQQLAVDDVQARLPDAEGWCITSTATPAFVNDGDCYAEYAEAPLLLTAPGFYDATVSVIMSATGTIHYTTDGSEPAITDALYSGPVSVSSSSVVKAKSFETGKLASPTTSGSYMINESTDLPVVSLSANSCDLFDEGASCIGAYDNAIAWNNFNPQIPVTVEYFNAAKEKQFDSRVKFEVVGNYSIDFPQKGIQLTTDEDFGSTSEMINTIFDKDKPSIDKYNGFRLRNADDDAYSARMRDVIVNRSALPTHAASAGYQNVAAYINGEYWGHYTAREKLDTYFIRDNYGSDPDSIDLIKTGFGGLTYPYDVEAGTDAAFYALVDLITDNDMTDDANYAEAMKEVDLENWTDYFATQFFFQNGDFLQDYHNNIRFFKSYAPELKWKFMLWDCAYGQNCSSCNTLSASLANPFGSYYADMLNSLLENETFHDYFINRFADLMNYYYTEDIVKGIIDDNAAELESEITAQNSQWGTGSLSAWNNDVDDLRAFFDDRIYYQRNQIEGYFDLDDQVNITIAVEPAGAGYIQISTIIPQTLPWTGVYFDGVPVTLTAIANPGYTFSNWSDNIFIDVATDISFTNNISSNTSFTANFTGSSISNPLVISEINYNSAESLNSGDWIELHNTSATAMDVSGVTFSTEIFYNKFEIPAGTFIPANGYLVLVQNSALFTARHPGVSNFIGDFLFNINNDGDSITLLDVQKNTIAALRFDDVFPWVPAADKYGRTMELISEDDDPALPSSWFAGCLEGSPGTAYTACNENPVIDEINYNSAAASDAGDWFEIYNAGPGDADMSSFVVMDKKGNAFTIPSGTVITSDNYLVLYENGDKFSAQFPSVVNKTGPLNFGLNNDNDVISIYDAAGNLFQTVSYADASPYPISPDGSGTALQVVDAAGNLNDPSNWTESCPQGTPGSAYLLPCPLSADAVISENMLMIYPNPAGNVIHIAVSGINMQNCVIQIYDPEGRVVFSGINNAANQININTTQLKSGMYYVVLRSENEVLKSKFIIEK